MNIFGFKIMSKSEQESETTVAPPVMRLLSRKPVRRITVEIVGRGCCGRRGAE